MVVKKHLEEVSSSNLWGLKLVDSDVIPFGPVSCSGEGYVVRGCDEYYP
jgi:hypothetical protein